MPSGAPVVHVLDDDEAVRDSLEMLLSVSGLRVRGWDRPHAMLEAAASLEPGCIVTDLRMPEMDGLTLFRELRRLQVTLPVIVMTGHGDVPLAVRAMREGAIDFLEKPFSKAQILTSVRSALSVSGAAAEATGAAELSKLSPREREVLQGLIDGQPNKVIAKDLGISPRTVEIHRAHVMEKTAARSLSELVRVGLAAGLTPRGR